MARVIQSFLPVEPPTVTHNDLKASVKYVCGRPVPFIRKSDRLKAAEDAMRPHVAKLTPENPMRPLRGALRETVKLVWRCDAKHPAGSARVTKPDADNVIKTLNDLLQSCRVIADDAMICDMRVMKMYGGVAGIWVRLEEME